MNQIVRINVSGRDRPGITRSLTSILARYPITVLDIDQAVIHSNLAWGMLIRVNSTLAASNDTGDGSGSGSGTQSVITIDTLFRELLFEAHELGLDIRFTPVTEDEYNHWVCGGGQSRHIITLLGDDLSVHAIARVSKVISEWGYNIATLQRVSPRPALTNDSNTRLCAIELRIRGERSNIVDLRNACLSLSSQIDTDIAIQEDNIWRRNRRLVCFDMDSTLIQAEVIDLIADEAGVGAKVQAITARAMNGEIDFTESFTERMSLLKGTPVAALEAIDRDIQITQGAEKLIRNLKHLGYKTAILSGGFSWFAKRLQQRLGIDHVHANHLEIVDGKLTGRATGGIVDENRKAQLLRSIAQDECICLEQTIAVGDGANDIPMLSIAGLGVAFHAKPSVRAQARNAFGTVGLDGILYLIGMRDDELL